MIPNPDYPYPECWAELPLEAKKQKAEEIFSEMISYHQMLQQCQSDFKLTSLLGYKIAVDYYNDKNGDYPLMCGLVPVDPTFMPVSYCGGNMCFGRVFAINHCSFSSPDSIVGFRNPEVDSPQEYFKILKGLRYIGVFKNWVLFKLDRSTTDDMTGMIYSPLEKNFTVEFAHFPHDAERRILFRLIDC